MKKKTKFLILRVTILAAFSILAGRLWYVQVVMGSYYKAQGNTSKIRQIALQAPRGIIYDRNGHPLVFNAPSWDVEIVPHGIPDNRASFIYHTLAHLFHGQPSAPAIRALVNANRWQPYAPAVIKGKVSDATAMIVKQLHYELPGVRADPVSVRSYVQDPTFSLSHILGYSAPITTAAYRLDRRLYPIEHVSAADQAGATGIESTLDPYIRGVNGNEQVEVDAGERPVRVLNHGHTVAGDSVYLTIDWKLQQAVSRDLHAALQHLDQQPGVNLRRAVAIVENVRNGQILSMVSLPSYNNNWFSGGIGLKRYSQLQNDPDQPLFDLATQGQFPPGSTYKVVTAAGALETGVTNANRLVDDTGQIKLCPAYSCIFHGWQASGLGEMNVVSALAQSSDIYFYTMAGGNPTVDPNMPYLGGTRLAHWARLFGLGSRTGIELPNEAPGFIPTPAWFNHLKPGPLKNPGDSWSIGYNYNSGIGQGFNLTTPLQMVNVAATIANGGTLYRPRLVKEIVGRVVPRRGVLPKPRVVQPFVPSVVRTNFISPLNLSLIQQGMHDSVLPLAQHGTSWLVVDPRINAAGKTGTAEDLPHTAHAWWMGYAPYNNPKIAVVVMVPNANSEGAYLAAPIAHKIFEDYFHLPPLKPDWLSDVSQFLVGSGTQ